MKKKHKLKAVCSAYPEEDQPHRILHESEIPEGTEFTTDDSDGVVTIRIQKIKYEEY